MPTNPKPDMHYIDKSVTRTEIDLESIPYAEWPARAQTLARHVMVRRWRELTAELPETRHSLLAAWVTRMSQPIDGL